MVDMKAGPFLRSTMMSGIVGLSALSAPSAAQVVGEVLQPPQPDCMMATARSRAARLLPALQRGFGLQYWGPDYTAGALAGQPHGLLIFEATRIGAPYSETGREIRFTPEEVARIGHDGARPLLGYLNVGKVESYRDYWADHLAAQAGEQGDSTGLPDWYGPDMGHGDHRAAFWTPAWRDIVLARVDQLMALGIDGLFLDDVLQYYSHALDDAPDWPGGRRPDGPRDAPGLAMEMMRLIVAIAARARTWNCDALIIVNNGVFIGRDAAEIPPGSGVRTLFAGYLDAIDALMIESVSTPMTHPHTREALHEDFQRHGVPVLALEIAAQYPDTDPEALRAVVMRDAARLGLFPYLAEDGSFSHMNPPIIPPPPVPAAPE